MRAEDRHRTAGNFAEFIHKHHAALAQFGHDMAVVNNFVEDKNRRAVQLQSAIGNFNRTDHPSTKTAWLRQQHLHHQRCIGTQSRSGCVGLRNGRSGVVQHVHNTAFRCMPTRLRN